MQVLPFLLPVSPTGQFLFNMGRIVNTGTLRAPVENLFETQLYYRWYIFGYFRKRSQINEISSCDNCMQFLKRSSSSSTLVSLSADQQVWRQTTINGRYLMFDSHLSQADGRRTGQRRRRRHKPAKQNLGMQLRLL